MSNADAAAFLIAKTRLSLRRKMRVPGKGRVSRKGQGMGRDGDGDGIVNEGKPKGGLNKGPAKVWVMGKGRPLPSSLHGVPFRAWDDAPTTPEGWAAVPGQASIAEPPLPPLPANKVQGSGVIIREKDGRVWLTKPTNGFGGYRATFPKGGVEPGLSPQANAIKEAFEETGLQVRITGFAADVKRSTSHARYYFAERVGGDPRAHGWESEAVLLAPPEAMPRLLNAQVDRRLAHDAFGAPKPGEGSDDPWAGLGGAAPLGGKAAAPFAAAAADPKPKKAGTFLSFFDDLWAGQKGQVKKAKGPKLSKKVRPKVAPGTLPPGTKPGTVPKDMDGDGVVFEGTKFEQPASNFAKPPAATTGGKAGPGGAYPSAAAPQGVVIKPTKPAAEVHGEAAEIAKWKPGEGGGAGDSAKKAIAKYEAMHAAGDLDGLLAAKPNYEALLPGKGNKYTKTKARVHKALVADLQAAQAAAIVAKAPRPAKVPGAAGATTAPVVPQTIGWKATGGQLGSNPGVQAVDAAGVAHYVKFAKSPAHAANEVAGAHLYDLAGHGTLGPVLVDATPLGGAAVSTATKWVPLTKFNPASAAHVKMAKEDFVTHAWLGNWDAIGANFDNLAIAGGKAVMVDTGGTMLFRAQGAKKAAGEWGPDVVEWDTMRALGKTPGNAPKVFHDMDAADLFHSAKKVALIPDDSIRKVVMAHGPGSPAERMALAETLIARKNNIIVRANALGQGDVLQAGAAATPNPAAVAKVVEPAPVKVAPPDAPAAAPAAAATAAAVPDEAAKAALLAALKDGKSAGVKAALTKKYASLTPQQAFDAAGPQYAHLLPKPKAATPPAAALAAQAQQQADDIAALAKTAPEAQPAVKAPPALPAKVTVVATPQNPNKGLIQKADEIEALGAAYASGKIGADEALAKLGAMTFGINNYNTKIKGYAASTMAAISAHAGISAAAAKGMNAVAGKAGAAMGKVQSPAALAKAPSKPPAQQKGPKAWNPATDAAQIEAPPNFLSWGQSGKPGPSSIEQINKANHDATQAIFALAKKGDEDAIAALSFPVWSKSKQQMEGAVSVLQHPSQHVKSYAEQAIAQIKNIKNPPPPLPTFTSRSVAELDVAFPTSAGGKGAQPQKIGRYVVLGEAKGAAGIGADWPKKTVKNGLLKSDMYTPHSQKGWAAMTQAQRDAVRTYTGGGYLGQTTSMWSGNPSGAAKAAAFAIRTHGHYVEAGSVISRKFTPRVLMPDGSLGAVDHQAIKALAKTEGKVLQDLAITSTGINPQTWGGNVQLKIKIGPGVKGLYVGPKSAGPDKAISMHPHEGEIILPPDTRFVVQRVRPAGSPMDEDGFPAEGQMVLEVLALPNDKVTA